MGLVKRVVGWSLMSADEFIEVKKPTLIRNFLFEYNMEHCNPSLSPKVQGLSLDGPQPNEPMLDLVQYPLHHGIGSARYLTDSTRGGHRLGRRPID